MAFMRAGQIAAAAPAGPPADVLHWLPEHATLYGGSLLFGTAALVGLLVAVLPRPRRNLARGPVVFLVIYPLLCLVRAVLPDGSPVQNFASYAALFFVLAALARTIFLLLVTLILERIGLVFPKIAVDLIQLGILAAVFLSVLHEAGVDASTLFTGSAVVTAVLGFALRDTLGNLVAGVTFQLQKPFQVGDWIQFDDEPQHVGQVTEVNWRETKLLTRDEVEVIVPNGTLATATVRNFTQPQPWSRRSLFVHVPYEVPPNRVHAIILEALADSWGVLAHPAPSVVTRAFTERGVEYWVRFFTTAIGPADKVDGEARDRIWYALARSGLDMPVATHAVRLTSLPAPEPELPADRLARRDQLLRQVDVFAVLPEECVRQVAGRARELLFGRGEVIIRQGEPGQSLYLIQSGEVVVTAAANGQRPIEINRLGPAAFFGEMSLLTGATRAATVTARTECRLLEVDKAAFESVLRAHPELAEEIGRVLGERRRVLSARLADQEAPHQEPRRDFFQQIREFFALT
jgi:small-conductance mechanosensitive channel/CRP-like cAMP-binding protein